jgi:hypothetical protein
MMMTHTRLRARYIVRDYSFREKQLYISNSHYYKCVAL